MASGEAVAGKKVGTHNGSFHCDEALGCFMMRLTSKFSDAEIVRSRDPKVGVCVCEREREREGFTSIELCSFGWKLISGLKICRFD